MSRRRGWGLAVAATVAAVAVTIAAGTVFAPAQSDERTFSGRYSPNSPISLVNLSVADGLYRIAYSAQMYVDPPRDGLRLTLTCGIVDTSGRIEFFDELDRQVDAGGWVTVEASGNYELPELTLGLRCNPERATGLVALVRDARIEATPYRPD